MFYCQLVVSSCICEGQLHPGCFAPVRENHLACCVLTSFKFSQNVYKAVIFQMSTLLSILVEISQCCQNYWARRGKQRNEKLKTKSQPQNSFFLGNSGLKQLMPVLHICLLLLQPVMLVLSRYSFSIRRAEHFFMVMQFLI